MDITNISMLSELNVDKEDSTIKVRIIRLWRQPQSNNTSEMVFIDEQGNKMQASVIERWFTSFETYLVEKNCLFIKNLSLGRHSSKYKYVDNPLKANFTPKSIVTRCTDFSDNFYGFNFTSFELLTKNELQENTTVDIIGYIESYFPIKDIKKRDGTLSKKMSLQVKDLEATKINITLWESYAEQMSDYLLTHKQETNVVIILQFGMFKFYEEHAGVSNSINHITKLIINEEIPDINLFKKKLVANNGNDASSSSRSTGPSMKMSIHDDFLTNTEFREIRELDEIKKAMPVILFGTIMPIPRCSKWYYKACKICNKQVIETVTHDQTIDEDGQNGQNKVYECPKCKQQLAEAIMRYKIPIDVQDSTGIVSLVLWDWEANKILKKSAKALYDEILNGDADMDLFPDDLKNLEDQIFAFKIDISDYNLKRKYKVYTISKITQDTKILNELQKRANVDQTATSAMMHAISVDLPSEDTSNFKDMDDVSNTTESATHIQCHEKNTNRLTDSQNSASSKSANADLKRKLVEINEDDAEEVSGHLTTKARPTPMGIEKLGKDKLLTPKVEK